MLELEPVLAVSRPYPGLRSFRTEESEIFFGREAHTIEVRDRLLKERFLAIIGDSGSGKSSLVRAGLLPALERGQWHNGGSHWRVCVMRPGGDPLGRLTAALQENKLGRDLLNVYEDVHGSTLGLVHTIAESDLKGDRVLLVVDQFEELFTFASERKTEDGSADARRFVASLLEAVSARLPPLYIVLTMRCDFLGSCAKFPGLAEALNGSQYLVPQLTREQVRKSIEEPVRLAGAEVNERLVERLINDLGDDASDLPILQHALSRTFLAFDAERNDSPGMMTEIQERHYEAAGTIKDALDKHAGSILDSLAKEAQSWVERVFRGLTREDGSRKVRRPLARKKLFQIIDAKDEARALAEQVAAAYCQPEHSLLVCSPDDDILDISHESLIERWNALKGWADKESRAVSWYQRAASDANRVGANLWRDPELSTANGYIEKGFWNLHWAEACAPNAEASFDRVMDFLKEGKDKQAKEQAEEEERKQSELKTARQAQKNAEDLARIEAGRARDEWTRAETERKKNIYLTALLVLSILLISSIWLLLGRSNELSVVRKTLQAELKWGARENPADGLEYVAIPGGEFEFGCSSGDDPDCLAGEQPRRVQVASVWIGKTEVTQQAWTRVIKSLPENFTGDLLPVETNWYGAKKYCEAIKGRLPTEEEWEHAARGRTTTPRYGDLDKIAWYSGNCKGSVHEVGKDKLPNEYGLFDMLGNVSEWVSDAKSAKSGGEIIRGGSWKDPASKIRAAGWEEVMAQQSDQAHAIGFRCVVDF